MPKNDTGEFELVLGNRQLLSGFAVVAILFGVFFAMGYIVGRNSTPSARLSAEAQAGQPPAAPPEPARTQNPPAAAPAPDSSAANPAQAQAPAEAAPPPATQPARPPEAAKPA